ncbi:MAG: hypothetical protein LLF94_11070 [Chlamydiales bacterium]|nr:hypothetical protein [Chlamydiales bacterium]
MRVKVFKELCPSTDLHKLLPSQKSSKKIKSRYLARDVVKTHDEAIMRVFLECIFQQSKTSNKTLAKRLFEAFEHDFDKLTEEEKRQFSDPFHKEIQKVASVFAGQSTSTDAKFDDYVFTLDTLPKLIKKLSKDNYKLAGKQEAEVNKRSQKHKGIQEGVAAFQEANETGYPHSVIQLDNSPKMVIIGVPRRDREDALRRFFEVLIQENVDVVVALNTLTDWQEAIAYFEREHFDTVKFDGYSVVKTRTKVLYEGKIAADMPGVQQALLNIPKEEHEALLASDEYKQYRPRIVERSFVIREDDGRKRRKLTQLHYENWPDRQAASDLDAWMVLLKRQIELQKKTLAIHCQGGIGRTNAHAILTYLVYELLAGKQEFNVPLTMYRLKQQAARLGGLVCGKRFWQIYEMLNRYQSEIEQKSASA